MGTTIDTLRRTSYANTGANAAKSGGKGAAEGKDAANKDRFEASSGRDTLTVSRGEKENSFIVHFTDSAEVSRAVSRGYITVNGQKIALTDEMKEKLTAADKAAQAKREAGYMKYVAAHEAAVAKQQSAALANAYKDMSKASDIAAKISRGGKVSKEEAEHLLKTNPQLYFISAAGASRKKGDGGSEIQDGSKGVSWDDFEWEYCETRVSVSLDGEPRIEGIDTVQTNKI